MNKIFILIFFIILSYPAISKDLDDYQDLYLIESEKLRLEKSLDYFKIVYKNYYKKGRFKDTIGLLNKQMPFFSEKLKPNVIYILAKSYYKTGNKIETYKNLKLITEQYKKSELIKTGRLANTILGLIEYESKTEFEWTLTFPLKLYYLLDKIDAEKNIKEKARNYFYQKLKNKRKISIDLKNNIISDYDRFEFIIVNTLWQEFFGKEYWGKESIDLKSNVSEIQIDKSFKYYADKLLVTVSIKQIYSMQYVSYTGYGLIETDLNEFLDSLNLTLENLFLNKTDLYYYEEEF